MVNKLALAMHLVSTESLISIKLGGPNKLSSYFLFHGESLAFHRNVAEPGYCDY